MRLSADLAFRALGRGSKDSSSAAQRQEKGTIERRERERERERDRERVCV